MIFLAVLVWATLTTEPPKIVKAFKTMDECVIVATKQNSAAFGAGPQKVKFVCLSLAPEA